MKKQENQKSVGNEEKVKNCQINFLQKKIALMKSFIGKDGFYKQYFSKLKDFKTPKETFENVNELYFELFGCYRFNSFAEFKNKIAE